MSFILGNVLSWFVPGQQNRRRVRARAVLNTARPKIKRFIKEAYGEGVVSIEPIRQITLNRAVYLVNDKYYVKVFRNVSNKKLKNFAFLVNYIRGFIHVEIPEVIISKRLKIYACKKIDGFLIGHFSRDQILANQDKIMA